MLTDPIGDMLTRIRNGAQARHPETSCPSSRLKLAVARVMSEEEANRYVLFLPDLSPKDLSHAAGELVQLGVGESFMEIFDGQPVGIPLHHLFESRRNRALDLFFLKFGEGVGRAYQFFRHYGLLCIQATFSLDTNNRCFSM